jgi:voltage-gated potassium channel Kch
MYTRTGVTGGDERRRDKPLPWSVRAIQQASKRLLLSAVSPLAPGPCTPLTPHFRLSEQVLANLMSTPKDQASLGPVRNFVAFDLEPKRVNASRQMGLPVYYGDGANKAVLHAAGVDHPHSVCVCYSSVARSTAAVERLRSSFGPSLPIFARARDLAHAVALEHAGATGVAVDSALVSLRLGGLVLREGGAEASEVSQAAQILEAAMLARARLSTGMPAKPDGQVRSRGSDDAGDSCTLYGCGRTGAITRQVAPV